MKALLLQEQPRPMRLPRGGEARCVILHDVEERLDQLGAEWGAPTGNGVVAGTGVEASDHRGDVVAKADVGANSRADRFAVLTGLIQYRSEIPGSGVCAL